jgi:hypothetical protein
MAEMPEKNAAVIAGLLNQLADLSAEGETLEAYRREEDKFEPALSAAAIALDLLALETTPEGRREALWLIKRLQEDFEASGELAAMDRLVEGLNRLEAPERRP